MSPEEVRNHVAAEIRAAMGRHIVTRSALAGALSLSIQTVSESLAGRRAFTTDELLAICEVLHLDFVDLMPSLTERVAS